MSPMRPQKILGAHISASRGLEASLNELGPYARCFAFFIRPRMTWKPFPPLSSEFVSGFRESLQSSRQFCLQHVAVHGSYLINLASHSPELRAKSIELMTEEVLKCEQLGIPHYVFHPGSCTGHTFVRAKKRSRNEEEIRINESLEKSLRTQSKRFVAESMQEVLSRTSQVTLVLENTAGQGNCIGADLNELREILDSIEMLWHQDEPKRSPERLGICLDTCHLFASGTCIDKDGKDLFLETSEGAYEALWRLIFDSIGAQWMHRNVLKLVHLNDSKAPAGSRKDQHANIGRGCIPIEFFQWIMQSDHFTEIPMILETPREKAHRKRTPKKEPKAETEYPSVKEEIDLLLSWSEK